MLDMSCSRASETSENSNAKPPACMHVDACHHCSVPMLQVAMLFRSHKDLLEEFTYFLPDAQAPAQVHPRVHHDQHAHAAHSLGSCQQHGSCIVRASVGHHEQRQAPCSLLVRRDCSAGLRMRRALHACESRACEGLGFSCCRLQRGKHAPKRAWAGGWPQTRAWRATCTSARGAAPGGATSTVTGAPLLPCLTPMP